jgi:hypothetical protein
MRTPMGLFGGSNMMQRTIAAFLAWACMSGAQATTFTTDFSDLWFNPNEQGWGVNVIQQGDTLFATLFVYSPNSAPTWYVGSALTYSGNQGGTFVFTGPLYQTSGPWFGGVFDPSAANVFEVGTATFRWGAISVGTLTYSVSGVTVTKSIQRQTWRTNNLNGTYIGASAGTYSGICAGGIGYSEEVGLISLSHSGSVATMTLAPSTGGFCNYSGQYVQRGRMGDLAGAVNCSNGATGQFTAFEIEGSISAFSARAIVQFGSCRWEGRLGGLRRGS